MKSFLFSVKKGIGEKDGMKEYRNELVKGGEGEGSHVIALGNNLGLHTPSIKESQI